jgi:hypothetical protein
MAALICGAGRSEARELAEFKTRVMSADETWVVVAWRAQVKNTTQKPIAVYVYVQLLDADGFMVEHQLSDRLAIAPGITREITQQMRLTRKEYESGKQFKAVLQ